MEIIGKRKIWYIISSILIVISIFSLVLQGFNFGIDFKGGTLLHIRFSDQSVDSEKIRAVLAEHSLQNSTIQESSDESVTIKMIDMEQDKLEEVYDSFQKELGEYELLRSEKVGPVIGGELRKAGLLALLIASILQIIYITVRFEFKFAIAAILALLHDVFITIGIFSILRLEVDTIFIAAVLTIIGYSINDTIVIFDRIRENVKNRKKESLDVLINRSIRQTIVRSINTSVAVLAVLLALFFLGGDTTKTFAIALIFDVLIGTYSSIFIASSLWYEFKTEEHRKVGVE